MNSANSANDRFAYDGGGDEQVDDRAHALHSALLLSHTAMTNREFGAN